MITIEYVKNKVKQLDKKLAEITEQVKEVVTNKTLPLNERWDLFVTSKLGTKEKWITRFDSINRFKKRRSSNYNDGLYDELFHDGEDTYKYEILDVEYIYYRLLETLREYNEWINEQDINLREWLNDGNSPDDYPNDSESYDPQYGVNITEFLDENGKILSKEAIDEFREEALSKMIYSYKFDW